MRRIEDFRLYYNHTIHPELMRMERKRKRLLWLLLASLFLLAIILFLQFYLNVLALSLLLIIPFGLYISFLLYRIQQFRATFKPHIVNLILDFIDDSLNYGTLKYDSKGFIEKKRFLSSHLFATKASYYQGEDFINGKIGELDFELCELKVKELSRVRNRLNYVFRGIFLHTVFNRNLRGEMIILPTAFKQYQSHTIRAFNRRGGDNIDDQLEEDFTRVFMTYATTDAGVSRFLSEEMQEVLVGFRNDTGKEIYVSFIENDIFIAITEPKDLLEPYIFKSNVSFDLVREFFEDIYLLMQMVEDIDNNN